MHRLGPSCNRLRRIERLADEERIEADDALSERQQRPAPAERARRSLSRVPPLPAGMAMIVSRPVGWAGKSRTTGIASPARFRPTTEWTIVNPSRLIRRTS